MRSLISLLLNAKFDMNGNVYRKQELGSFLLSPLSGHILRNTAKKEAKPQARNRASLPFAVFKLSRRHANCCLPSEPSIHPSSVGGFNGRVAKQKDVELRPGLMEDKQWQVAHDEGRLGNNLF